MPCKSIAYTVLNTPTDVEAGGIVPVGTLARRYGNAIRVDGNAITLTEAGWYTIAVNMTAQPTAATTITLNVLENGAPLYGANTTTTTFVAAENAPLVIPAAVVRVFCRCCKTLTITLSEAASVVNSTITVEKVSA